MRCYRGRFAPSPTGPLHFGSLVAAVGSWVRARSRQGTWLVRIEDLDPPREIPGAAADIVETLKYFGMESDEPVLYQSQRHDQYAEAFGELERAGHVFACCCSRTDLQAQDGMHHGACVVTADPTRTPAWRIRAPDMRIDFDDVLQGRQSQDMRSAVGDFVVKRVEGWHAYHLAVVVDDALQGITEIARGLDLLDSTPRQIYLQRLLGYATPEYLHLPLVVDASGQKLSKQDRARPIDRRDPAPQLRAALSFLGVAVGANRLRGQSTPSRLLQRAVDNFDVTRLRKSSAPAT